ncbi:MAG: DUF2807 domain-containing protein [Bacteroides sp.]|nr:DUF2807 domain-containing protein [Bacteroides sp.]
MRKLTILLTWLVIALNVTSCQAKKASYANDDYKTRKFNLDKFKEMEVNGSFTVTYIQSDKKPFCEISASDQAMSDISVEVINNTLVIKYKQSQRNNSWRRQGRINIWVSGPALEKIALNGSGKVTLPEGMKTKKDLTVRLSGSGKVIAEALTCNTFNGSISGSGSILADQINCKHVDATISGSGHIKLSGNNNKTGVFKVNGSGHINAENLTIPKATAQVNGSGHIRVLAIETLDGRVNGSGRVSYRGNPSINFPGKGLRRL